MVKVLSLSVLLAAGVSYIFAWTGPSTTPPGGNVAAPLNVATSSQTKMGPLIVNYANLFSPALELLGPIQIVDGTQASGSVLTSDANGIGHWATSTLSEGNLQYVATTPTEIFGRGFKMGDQANDGSPSVYAFPAEYFDSNSTYTNEGSYVTVNYPTGIPSNATALEVKFFAYSNGGSYSSTWDSPTTQLWVKASNMPETVVVSAHDAIQDSNADSETNTMLIPYSSDRQVQFKWNTSASASGSADPAAVRAIVVGYMAG